MGWNHHLVWITHQIIHPPKTNVEPENGGPLEEENYLPETNSRNWNSPSFLVNTSKMVGFSSQLF